MFQPASWMYTLILASWSTSFAATADHELKVDPGERLSRYQISALVARAEQTDPLNALVDIVFPEDVERVGQAVTYVLKGSGYRLADFSPLTCQNQLFGLPLPSVHRQLGPLSVKQALEVLAGPGWRLMVDRAERTVRFEVVPLGEDFAKGGCRCG